jgi:hypothetical protein
MAAKVIGSDSLNWAAGQLVQSLGGRGYMENNLAPQILRDARLYSVGEGPNEPLTIQVGRKARLTDAIDGYLRADPAGALLADQLATSTLEIADRCVNRPGPFADRASAQLWTDALIGQLAVDMLVLAAVRSAQSRHPPGRLLPALEWAGSRLAQSLERAREGGPKERLMPTASAAAASIALYVESIGDVEQTLASEEDTLDLYLSNTGDSGPSPPVVGLPGQAVLANVAPAIADAPPRDEPRRDRLTEALPRRLETALPGNPAT